MKLQTAFHTLLFLFVIFTGSFTESCASESFSVRILDDVSGTADVFPETALNFMAKFKRDSVLFEVDSRYLTKGVEKDSTFQYAIIYHRMFGEDIKPARVLKMTDYITLKSEYEQKQLWLNSVAKNLGIEFSTLSGGGGDIVLDIPFKIKSRTFHRVFGGDNIGLRVRGSLSISIIGQKSYTDLPNVDNTSFDFTLDQTQNISIRGKVGTKVDVDIAQNTESFDFENSLKITYTGESDEIIQKMEAGNIGLSLPGTRFVSFSGVNKGLFGLKTETKVGKLKSTSIASFEKGKKNQIEIKGGVREQEKTKNAKDYLRYKYFYIEPMFKDNMASPENYDRIKEHRPLVALPYKIKNYSLELYITRTETGVQRKADIYIDYLNPTDTISGYPNLYKENLNVKLIEEDQYEINHELGYVRLKSLYLSGSDILAVRYVKQNVVNLGDEIEIGSIDSAQTKLELQILAEYDQEQSDPWFDLEWKNVYSLDGVDISRDGFKLTIQRNTPEGLKTEEYDSDNVTKPYLFWYDVSDPEVSDKVDLGFLNSANGEFIFPNQTPFMPDDNSIIFDYYDSIMADSLFSDPNIYTDKYYTSSQYQLKFEFASKSSTYDLGFNVLEGSEVVRSGATTLKKDVDYIINYNSGQLSIINDRYLSADIEILYESASIFQLDQKLLVGNRFDYTFSRDTYLGATVLYLSEASTQEKVHVGYEPKKNLILGLNGQTKFDLPYLTSAIDWLPFIATDRNSSISFEGEIAQIIPNPNPLNVAYIDDFESSRIKKSLGISYGIWSEASYPDFYGYSGTYNPLSGAVAPKRELQYFLKSYSGNSELSFYWYNPKDEDKLTKEEIYLDVPGDEKKDKVSTLDLVFKPAINEEAFESLDFHPEDSWGGVMRYLHHSYQDFREVKYIEFLVSTNRNISLNFDIGELSEDVVPNSSLDSEDENRNNVLDIGTNTEDTGLDGMRGSAGFYPLEEFDTDSLRERLPYEFYSFDNHPTESNGDPVPDSQLDNYWDFIKTQGNGILDSEDLDGGGNLDTSVKAYRYTVNLRSSPVQGENYVVSTSYRQGSNFALYRIPVEDFAGILNQAPDISKMEYMKIWVNNSQDTLYSTKINFVSLDLVGNEWAAKGVNNGKIEAKTINNEDDKGRYYSPPGVKEYDDLGFEKPEQSLSMNVTLSGIGSELEDGEGRYAFLTKNLIKGENYLQYEELKMFLHGGTMANDPFWDDERPLYFIYRFGTDSVNYYEYRSKLVNGWKNEEVNNQMIIKLNDLSYLKTSRSDNNFRTDSIYLENYNDENIKRYIGIRGNPTLQSVKYFNAGILDSAGTSLDTEIWMNELRLAKVLKDPGVAMRAKTRIEFADLGTVDAEITSQDENFHRIEQNRGSGVNQQNLSFNTSLTADKLLPKKLGVSLPVRYSYNNTSSYTKYQGTTDILVDKSDIPDSVRTESTRNQFDFSLNRTLKSESPYLKYTVDNLKLTGNASLSETSNQSYVYQKSKNFNYTLGYNLNLPDSWFSLNPFSWGKDVFFFDKISGVKFSFFPSSYNFSLNTGQSETLSLSRKNNFTESRTFTNTRNFSTSLTPLPFMNSSYGLVLKSDMYKDVVKKDSTATDTLITAYDRDFTDLLKFQFGQLTGLESSLKNNVKVNVSKYLTNDLSLNTAYSWSGNLSSRSVTGNMKNRYDSRVSSKINTKEIISGIQSGLSKILPEKKPAEKKESVAQGTIGSAGEDSVKVDPEKSPAGSRFSRTGSVKSGEKKKSILDFLKTNLSDFSLSYSQGRENSFSDLKTLDQANPSFFLGFGDRPDVADSTTSSSWSGNWGLNGSTRLGLTKNLSLDGISYQFTRSYRQNNNEGFTGNDTETGFIWPFVTDEVHKKEGTNSLLLPNYSIGISGLEELLQAKDKISSITLSHSKSGTVASQWYVDGPSPELFLTGIPDLGNSDLRTRSVSYNTSFSPLVGLRLTLKNGLNFSANYNYSFDLKETYSNTDDKSSIQSGEKKYTKELRISGGYNQKGGINMPFNFWPFNGKRLENDISYNLTLSYSSNNRYKYDIETKEYESLENGIKSDSFTIAPDISYKLSKNLNGTMSYSYNYNESQNYEAKSVVNTNHKFELRAVLSISGR
ncbi:MAG: cell surface protein SprA [Candidatus Delongbacteria bacterium]|nr:cell surface protein SprA [Candidatus Delongbacteria bacterium]